MLSWLLCLFLLSARGAVIRSLVSDLVQRRSDQSLDDALVEQLITVDFEGCQRAFADAGPDRVRLVLNLTDGRSVPVWLQCNGVYYDTPLEPAEFLPLKLRLHEHTSCEGDVLNLALAPAARTPTPGASTSDEIAADNFWGDQTNATAGARRRLVAVAYENYPFSSNAEPQGPPVVIDTSKLCTQGADMCRDARHFHTTVIRGYLDKYLNVSWRDVMELGKDTNWDTGKGYLYYDNLRAIFEQEHKLASMCLVPMLCTGGDTLPGYAEPALHRTRALELHQTQARLRLATAPYIVWMTRHPFLQDYLNSPRAWSGHKERTTQIGADTDHTQESYNKMQQQDQLRQLAAFQPLDGRAACASAQADFWERARRAGLISAHVLSITRVSFRGDANAPAQPPAAGALSGVQDARAMYKWLQTSYLAPNLQSYPQFYEEKSYATYAAKLQRPRSESGYPTQWQWDPPCRAPVGGAYDAVAESVACRGPDSAAPGPNALYPRVFASDNRCKFTNGTADGRDTQEAYGCVPSAVYAAGPARAAAWGSLQCSRHDEKVLYCALAEDGGVPTPAGDVARDCFGGTPAELRRALVASLWLLLDADGLGYVEPLSAEEGELALYQRYFCTKGQLASSYFWFRSAGNASDPVWLRGAECPCAESTNEGLKVCPVNPWERLTPAPGTDHGRLRTHGQLQACVRNRGRSYCAPLLDFGALRAAQSQTATVKEDKCESPFVKALGHTEHYSGSQLYAMLLFAAGQISALEKLNFDCTEAHKFCALPAARDFTTEVRYVNDCRDIADSVHPDKCWVVKDGRNTVADYGSPDCKQKCNAPTGESDQRQYDKLKELVSRCFGTQTLADATNAGAGAAAVAEVQPVEGATCSLGLSAPQRLPSFNRLLLTTETYDLSKGGTVVRSDCSPECVSKSGLKHEAKCKPNYVVSESTQSLRLTVAKAALDVSANAAALESFVAQLTGKKDGGAGSLSQIAEDNVKNMQAQVRALNLSADINDWLDDITRKSLENMQDRLALVGSKVNNYTARFDSQAAKITGHFAELGAQLGRARALIELLDENSDQAVAELRALGAAVEEAQAVTQGLMQDFAVVMGKSAANSAEVAALARRLLYGRERYVRHVQDVQEELALTRAPEVPFLPTTPYGAPAGAGAEYGVAPRRLAQGLATAPSHELRLWQALQVDGSVWLYQLRLLQLCDLRWLQEGLYSAGGGLDLQQVMDSWGPADCKLGSLSPKLRCGGCRLRVTAERCWADGALATPAAVSDRYLHNVTWLRLGLARLPLGAAGVCAGPVGGVPAAPGSAWGGARPLPAVVSLTSHSWGQQARPPGTDPGPEHETAEDLATGAPGLDLASAADVRGLLTAVCQGPQTLFGLAGNWSARPVLAASFGPTANQSATYAYWNLAGVRASAARFRPGLESLQQLREWLVCDSNVRTARSLATLQAQIQTDPAQYLVNGSGWGLYMSAGGGAPWANDTDRAWFLTPYPLALVALDQWAGAVRRLANSPLSVEFRYATEGLLPPLGLRTEFSQRAPPPPNSVAAFVAGQPSLWSQFELPPVNTTTAGGGGGNVTAQGGRDIAFQNALADTQALMDELVRNGASQPGVLAEQELQLLRQNEVPTDLVNCYSSSWLTHEGSAVRLHRVAPAPPPRIELSVQLDRDSLAGAGGAELAELERTLAALQWELVDYEVPGADALAREWYYGGEVACALEGGCREPAPGVGGRYVLDVDPVDVCRGDSAHMRATRSAGGVCINTVRLPWAQAQPPTNETDDAANEEATGGGAPWRPADRGDGTWDMFRFEDFYRHEHGSLVHPAPAADDFDPRGALLSPAQLARQVFAVAGRLFCAGLPGAPPGRPCAVLNDFEPAAAAAGGGLRWRAASGGGRVTAQLRVPTNLTSLADVGGGGGAGGGGGSALAWCPRQTSVSLPGTPDMSLEFWATAALPRQLEVWTWGGGPACSTALPGSLHLLWPLVSAECPEPSEVRLSAGGVTCFVWQSAAPIAATPEHDLLVSSYSNEQGLLLGQVANLTLASLQTQAELQRLITNSLLSYGAGWVTRSPLGVWRVQNLTTSNLTRNNTYGDSSGSDSSSLPGQNGTGVNGTAGGRRRLLLQAADPLSLLQNGAGSQEDALAALAALSDVSVTGDADLAELVARGALLQTGLDELERERAALAQNWSDFDRYWQSQNGTRDEAWDFLGSLAHRPGDAACLLEALGTGPGGGLPDEVLDALAPTFQNWSSVYTEDESLAGLVRTQGGAPRAALNRGVALGSFFGFLFGLWLPLWALAGWGFTRGLEKCCAKGPRSLRAARPPPQGGTRVAPANDKNLSKDDAVLDLGPKRKPAEESNLEQSDSEKSDPENSNQEKLDLEESDPEESNSGKSDPEESNPGKSNSGKSDLEESDPEESNSGKSDSGKSDDE